MEFATLKENALLLYNKPSSRDTDEFIALELIDGSVRFSFALGAGNVSRLTVPTGVADGRWHRIIAERDGKVTETFLYSSYFSVCKKYIRLFCFQNGYYGKVKK